MKKGSVAENKTHKTEGFLGNEHGKKEQLPKKDEWGWGKSSAIPEAEPWKKKAQKRPGNQKRA